PLEARQQCAEMSRASTFLVAGDDAAIARRLQALGKRERWRVDIGVRLQPQLDERFGRVWPTPARKVRPEFRVQIGGALQAMAEGAAEELGRIGGGYAEPFAQQARKARLDQYVIDVENDDCGIRVTTRVRHRQPK